MYSLGNGTNPCSCLRRGDASSGHTLVLLSPPCSSEQYNKT